MLGMRSLALVGCQFEGTQEKLKGSHRQQHCDEERKINLVSLQREKVATERDEGSRRGQIDS